MFRSLLAWLDNRTGWKGLLHEALFERIPGGARWRYVWGSTLTFTFLIQVLTGVVLWAAYSPSSQTAWESVFYIQHVMWGGAVVRGIHHYTAQMMNVLLLLHFLQVMIDGAYRAPREVNFWFGVMMLMVVLALSLTGYLLPWDQKGYWATRVATNIVGVTPFIGPSLQHVLVGGAEYGHHTLTRFFALHAGVLPGILVLLTVAHVLLFRKHGITARKPFRKPDAYFWPDQLLMDGVACLSIMAVVLGLFLSFGTPLDAPADPSEPFSAARPEWYFLFLFELLKYFPGQTEIIGAIILPTLIVAAIFLMPVFARWWFGRAFNLIFLATVIFAILLLTALALRQDFRDPAYQRAVLQAERDAERVKVLAKSPRGIPGNGAVALLREDPFSRGPRLFAQHCAACHRYDSHNGLGEIPRDPPSASDLKGFASREWLAGLLDPARADSPHYFGATRFRDGKMVRFVKREVAGFDTTQLGQLQAVVKALSAEAALPSQRAADAAGASDLEAGRKGIRSDTMRCTECHEFHQADESATAPALTGYGSREWILRFLHDPSHAGFYGKRNDRMPAYGRDRILGEQELGVLADWLRGDWYEPALATHP